MSPQEQVDLLLKAAQQASVELTDSVRVAFVACSYDTAFESIGRQVRGRMEQLTAAYGIDGPIQWSLWIVDDLPTSSAFGPAVETAMRAYADLYQAGRLRTVPMHSRPQRIGGLKGRALLDGMSAALDDGPALDAVVYLNLNLKVDARLSALGLLPVLTGLCDAAVGSRAHRDGGVVLGAGNLGRAKSLAYSFLARSALPPLDNFQDTNAPLKVFSSAAARALVQTARIDQVTLDCEWLMIMHAQGFSMNRFPVAWIQRGGSRPPWHLIPLSVRDIFRIRRAWKAGRLE